MVVYNERGELQWVQYCQATSPLHAETLAVDLALQVVSQGRIPTPVAIVSDCQVLTNLIQAGTPLEAPNWEAVQPIAQCIHRMRQITGERTLKHEGQRKTAGAS